MLQLVHLRLVEGISPQYGSLVFFFLHTVLWGVGVCLAGAVYFLSGENSSCLGVCLGCGLLYWRFCLLYIGLGHMLQPLKLAHWLKWHSPHLTQRSLYEYWLCPNPYHWRRQHCTGCLSLFSSILTLSSLILPLLYITLFQVLILMLLLRITDY